MKTPVFIALLAFCTVQPLFADKTDDLIAQGKAAEKDGDVDAARAAYTSALQISPANANARYLLDALKANSGSVAARARAKRLSEIKISQIDFDKVELPEALEALGVMVEKQSGDKFAPNFMIQDPKNALNGRTLTLKVRGIPAKAALEMILDQVGAKVRYDQHAVVVSPRGT